MRIGAGAGIGYLRAKGSALLNLARGDERTEQIEDPEVRSFDVRKQTWRLSG